RHQHTGQGHAQTVNQRRDDRAVDQRYLVQKEGKRHLVVEVDTFTGTLTHTGEHGETAVRLGEVVDQRHHVHGRAHTGTTEQTDLATLGEGADQVDDLDTGFQQIGTTGLLGIAGRRAVDAPLLVALNRAGFVDRLAQYVHDAAQGACTNRYGNGLAGVGHVQATLEAFGATHGDGTDDAVTQLLLDFQGGCCADDFQRVIDVRHLIAREFHV